jgi:general secretion pathway protein E
MPDTPDIPTLLDSLLEMAIAQGASDLHLEPTAEGCEVRLRVDGRLRVERTVDAAAGRALANRLMVLAQLLTYRQDVPQEGKLAVQHAGRPVDLRVAVIPTVHGLRAAVRLPAELIQPRRLGELGLGPDVLAGLQAFLRADSGMLIVTGPAGSGKTTTLYALLTELQERQPGLSIISLEDPVERHLPGITQIEVTAFGQLTYERALRSILRQDPQVLMLGEIRDAATAALAVEAALSGHRLLCTLHASDPAGALARLLEMGVEPCQLTSAIHGVLSQRLLRRMHPEGGYRGRTAIGEYVPVDGPLRRAILQRADADGLRQVYAARAGYVSLAQAAARAVEAGITDATEAAAVAGGLSM